MEWAFCCEGGWVKALDSCDLFCLGVVFVLFLFWFPLVSVMWSALLCLRGGLTQRRPLRLLDGGTCQQQPLLVPCARWASALGPHSLPARSLYERTVPYLGPNAAATPPSSELFLSLGLICDAKVSPLWVPVNFKATLHRRWGMEPRFLAAFCS